MFISFIIDREEICFNGHYVSFDRTPSFEHFSPKSEYLNSALNLPNTEAKPNIRHIPIYHFLHELKFEKYMIFSFL